MGLPFHAIIVLTLVTLGIFLSGVSTDDYYNDYDELAGKCVDVFMYSRGDRLVLRDQPWIMLILQFKCIVGKYLL